MLVLAFDTSTLTGVYGFAAFDGAAPRAAPLAHAERSDPAAPGHAETLLARLEELLRAGGLGFRDVDLVVWGRGPGTFTGLRIGLATAKGLALATGAPIAGVSSLAALAFSAGAEGRVAALIDARRGELFHALYDAGLDGDWPELRTIVDESVGPAAEALAAVSRAAPADEVLLVGNGIAPYRQQITSKLGDRARILSESRWAPSAFWLARFGRERFLAEGPDDLDAVEPVYLRAPDARLPK